jgi:hypothetical protein
MFSEELTLPISAKWSVDGDDTHTLWWPMRADGATHQTSRTVLMFVCGNPGVVDYYRLFLTTIYQKLGRQLDIIGGRTSGTGINHKV